MTGVRRRSLGIPTDEAGMLGRECPRCREGFTIGLERYEERGFMNLRCPYCRFIAELDRFTTPEQRQYVYSTTQNMARRAMEQAVEEAFSGMSGSSRGGVELTVGAGTVDFGRVPTEAPARDMAVESLECEACGFSFGVADGSEGVCPVCR